MQENAALQKRASAATVNVKLNLSSLVGVFVAANRPGPKAGANETFAPSFLRPCARAPTPPHPRGDQEAIAASEKKMLLFPLAPCCVGWGVGVRV